MLERKHSFDLEELNDLQLLIGNGYKYSNLFENKLEVVEQFVKMQTMYSSAMKEVNTKLEILDDEFRSINQYNPIHHLECRVKSPRSILKKAMKSGEKWNLEMIQENIHDIAGVRVICNYTHDIFTVERLLLKQKDIKLVNKKDFITTPKKSGYRGIHLIISVPVFLSEKTEYIPVEIQLRTLGMDMWASLEHKLRYKNRNGKIDEEISTQLEKCSHDIANIDNVMENIHKKLLEN